MGHSELLVQLQLQLQLQLQALVLPGAPADRGWAVDTHLVQVALDDRSAVQPLHYGHEVVQLLQAAVLLLKKLQDGRCGASLAGQEPGRRYGRKGKEPGALQ